MRHRAHLWHCHSRVSIFPIIVIVSIKEDAKDLLERYSDLLLAEVLRKVGGK